MLAQGERSVEEIADEIGQSVATPRTICGCLRAPGCCALAASGTHVFYRLASERVEELWAAVRGVAVGHAAEVGVLADGYLGDRGGVEQLSAAELGRARAWGRSRARRSSVDEYRAGHIAGARSAPLAVLAELAGKLPRRREIVAYCRGPYCVYADDAVRLLKIRGLNARRLDAGFPEWRRAGLPVEVAS